MQYESSPDIVTGWFILSSNLLVAGIKAYKFSSVPLSSFCKWVGGSPQMDDFFFLMFEIKIKYLYIYIYSDLSELEMCEN